MTIQRQYSLPNCTLLLEGLTETTTGNGQSDGRPVMSILVNSECHFVGQSPPLAGGRDFFESLVKAVSRYAQEFLSGVHYPRDLDNETPLVQLQPIDGSWHRLIVYNRNSGNLHHGGGTATTLAAPITMELTTVQLFDLVEAVDQFLADSQTLPELSLNLAPLPKRYAKADQPVVQRAAPAILGVSSVAVAAIALFFFPVDYRQVEQAIENAQTQQRSLTTPDPAAPANSGEPPLLPQSNTGAPSSPVSASRVEASAIATNGTQAPVVDDLNQQLYNQLNQAWQNRAGLTQDLEYRVSVAPDGTIVGYKPVTSAAFEGIALTPLPQLLRPPTATPDATSSVATDFRVVFTSQGMPQVSPWTESAQRSGVQREITDNSTLRSLQRQIRNKIVQNRQEDATFSTRLTYRVAVLSNGTILDYEPLNQAASDYVNLTPLPQLKSSGIPADTATGRSKRIAYFRVEFTPRGVPEVSPWRGFR